MLFLHSIPLSWSLMMNLSFREKSLGLLVLSLIVIFGFYFASVLPAQFTNVMPSHIMSFIGMLILLIVIQIIGNTLIAIASRRELAAKVLSDERDALINLTSSRLGSYVLSFGVSCSLCIALFVPGNFAFVHTLLAFWVLSQVVETVSQLILYRRGV